MARREKRIPDYGNAPTLARAGGRLAGRTARCSPYYGIALSADALALSLENERMVYASMYGKANGTFTDKDILSAKNGTRASAFFFALSIMGASEAVRAWKLLSKYNNLIPPVQDGLASMKNGRALLESLSPNELSRLSQFRSDDVIYSLMDTMKNGKIGGGITLDEYINIRQQSAKSVGGGNPTEWVLQKPYNISTTGMKKAEREAVIEYAQRTNVWLRKNGAARVQPTQGVLRSQSNVAARTERLRAARAGTPYQGQAGHVPDTAISGQAIPPEGWLDMPGISNSTAGGGLSSRIGQTIDHITVDGSIP